MDLFSPSYIAPPLIAVAVTLGLLLVAILWSHRDFTTRVFSGFLLSMVVWNILIFGMRASPDVQHALIWEKGMVVTGMAAFVFYYHFTLVYTNTWGQRRFLLTMYLLLLVFVALVPTDLFVSEMQVRDFGYAPVMGLGTYIMAPVGLLLLTGGAINLLRYYRLSSLREERIRIVLLVVAALLPLIGGLLDGFTDLPPLAIWSNLLFSVLCSVAILRYHLLDIRIFLRRSLVYLLVSIVVAIPYAGMLLTVNQVIKTRPAPWWTHALIVLVLAVMLRPLYSWAQQLVDRLFYRERYDFLRELEYFSQETHGIRNSDQLVSSLVKLVSRALQSSSVHLLLPSKSGDFITAASVGEDTSQLTIPSHSPLLPWLRSNEDILRRQDLDTVPQLQALTAKARNEFEKIRANLFVPLKTKEEELVGILILGEKLSEQPYCKDDESLIVTVVSRVVVELENTHLYALERSTRRELERQDEQKTQFLHSVAHELKTPLTAIISSSELLRTELSSITPGQGQKLVRNINRSAWLMDKRVTELLTLARIQVGGLELKSESLEIGVIIDEVTSQLLPLFMNKEQSLDLEIAASLSPVEADREKLGQILVNLLSNANKFSPAGGNIALRAREADGRMVVEVRDSAPAITEEEKERLFDPYYRGVGQNVPGLGLGLSISRKLVELHQGEIWVESEPGKGNVFAFSLPT